MKRWAKQLISLLMALALALALALCACAREGDADIAARETPQALEVTLAPAPAPTATPAPTQTPTEAPTQMPTESPEAAFEPTDTPEIGEATPAPGRPVADIVEDMAVYYGAYGERAEGLIDDLLGELAETDPLAAEKWARIMDLWRTQKERLTVNRKVLPDGLPDTSELCILVLGYQLNSNGTMKTQLKERLKVALASAKKYPNAYIVCSGGGTASKKKSATEAGQMASWLKKQGVSKSRIIVEKSSHTTAQNIRYTYALLTRDYPQITQVALVTSDYHVGVGALLFEAEAILQTEPGEEPRLRLISNAANKTSSSLSALFQAGGLVELAGNSKSATRLYHNTYSIPPLP